jgi:hypothetical protein
MIVIQLSHDINSIDPLNLRYLAIFFYSYRDEIMPAIENYLF